jgi:ferredoxin-NADP reductase
MKLEIIHMNYPIPDSVTLHFKKPVMVRRYKPGQYGVFVFSTTSGTFRRSYSLHSVYDIDQELRITIRAVAGGKVSNGVLTKEFSSIDSKILKDHFLSNPLLTRSAI